MHHCTSISDYDKGPAGGKNGVVYMQNYISKPSENVTKCVTLRICSLLNISLKYMTQRSYDAIYIFWSLLSGNIKV